jgi:uncharacterized protein
MILVDANLLLYAALSRFPQHEAARDWLDARLNGPTKVGLPWPSLLAFLRIATNARIFERPMTVANAWVNVRQWLDRDTAWIPAPTERHASLLEGLLAEAGAGANLVPDAHLAALAIEHGLELCSSDRGFARFSGLRWSNPIAT